eukprot:TRINITY_DN3942_c0_g1_i1.p1 TRINITY_DN3942_c0_g1~~TRINITY_DN3942_c0_g1_i1.p1  ORF type:complete len:199 (-),score=22.52 TRINITY_DN3942_c0_g1_i1:74-670(-)
MNNHTSLDALDRSLKASFVGTANQLTQMYTNSLNFQKQAYVLGYNQSSRDTLEHILKQVQSKKTITVEQILEHLRSRLEDGSSKSEESVQQDNAFKFAPSFGPADQNFSNQPQTSFMFSAPQQDQTSTPSSTGNIFNFVPPADSGFFPTHQQPQPQQTNSSFVYTPEKKRQFDNQQNSMDFTYPDQNMKKSRVRVEPF